MRNLVYVSVVCVLMFMLGCGNERKSSVNDSANKPVAENSSSSTSPPDLSKVRDAISKLSFDWSMSLAIMKRECNSFSSIASGFGASSEERRKRKASIKTSCTVLDNQINFTFRDNGITLSDCPQECQSALEKCKEAFSEYRMAANIWIDNIDSPNATSFEGDLNKAYEKVNMAIENLKDSI